jgi:stearoyl-CoA desaturase (delta-9 desaturase)
MTTTAPETRSPGPIPDLQPEPIGGGEKTLVAIFVVVPLLALLAAIPLAWGWGLGWHDIVIAVVFYLVSGLGISMGYHR